MLRFKRQILRWKLLDYVFGESILLRTLLVWASASIGCLLWLLGRRVTAFQTLGKSHAVGSSPIIESAIQRWVRRLLGRNNGSVSPFARICQAFATSYCHNEKMQVWAKDPSRLLGSRILVVKSPQMNEKGVIVLDYSYVFPLFMHLFDIGRIVSNYQLVLEPSWTGFCTLEILSYAALPCPVFVQVSEPRDAAFVDSLQSNLITIPTAANWWVDHRVVRPDPTIKKEIDLIMVAAWTGFKRHWSFFECLSRMRRRGRHLTVALVGYPQEYSMADIKAVASEFGVLDQIEFYEWLSPLEVTKQLNRAKALVLWSRREGFNRAILEAMLADIPVILREGFNYGYRYPYINDLTGTYATEDTFEDVVQDVLTNRQRFSPRDWVIRHMTCQHATDILQRQIRETSCTLGESWTQNLVVKTTTLNCQSYWDEADRLNFEADYVYLASCIRNCWI